MERTYDRSLGTVLVAVGVALLLVGFALAFREISTLPSDQPPTARFAWTLADLTATFSDRSSASGATISTVYWSFGDGSSNSSLNPTHTYGSAGSYTVVLAVQDSHGGSAQTVAQLLVPSASPASGASSPSMPIAGNASGSIAGLAAIFGGVPGLVKTYETFLLLVVVWLVGSSILRAGWNLITPKAETISVRVRPRWLQAEPVASSTGASTPGPGSAGTSVSTSPPPPA